MPEFADWCSIEIPAADGPDRAGRDGPSRPGAARAGARAAAQRYPVHIDRTPPIGDVLRSGRAGADRGRARAICGTCRESDDQLAALREVAIGSVIIVPLIVGGSPFGALTFVNHDGQPGVRRRRPRDRDRGRPARRARDRERPARRRARPGRRRPPARAAAAEPAADARLGGGDDVRAGRRGERGRRRLLRGLQGRGRLGGGARRRLRQGRGGGGADRRGTAHDPHRRRARGRPGRAGSRCSTATCAGATTSPSARSRCWCCPTPTRRAREVLVYLAGHPAPDADQRRAGRCRWASPGPLLGVVDEPAWPGVTVAIEPGDQLVLYTDGVIEARGDGRRALRRRAPARGLDGCESPDLAVERVRGALSRFGARARDDDAALVAIRRTAGERTARRPGSAPSGGVASRTV